MEEGDRSYRFGILCSGFQLALWQSRVIQQLLEDGHLAELLIFDNSSQHTPSISQKVKKYTGKNALFNAFERLLVRPNEKTPVDMQEILVNADVMQVVPEEKGYSQYFKKSDIEDIKAYDLDFVLRFGFNILRGEVLDVAKYGVWSYHHDDEMVYRGGPPGFWEIANSDPANGVILQRLTNRLDGGIILHKGWFKTTDHSYSGNLDYVLKRASGWPAWVCKCLAENDEALFSNTSHSAAPIYLRPDNMQMTRFLFKKVANRFRFHYAELFMAEKWNIALGTIDDDFRLSGESITLKERFSLPKPPRNHFYADPFVIHKGEMLYILFEDYSYKTRKGVIGYFVFDLNQRKVIEHNIALEKPTHLAYPYMLHYQDEIYCVPETASSGNVDLYRLNTHTGELDFVTDLLSDFPGVDPSLFYHDGYWWLFCSHKDASNEDLYVFYADELMGPYIPHCKNPVKTDIRSARPAGNPFVINEKLYRPAQMNTGMYGAALTVNQVLELSPEKFTEQSIHTFLPQADNDFKKGFHTLSGYDNYVVLDGKQYGFNYYYFIDHLRKKIARNK